MSNNEINYLISKRNSAMQGIYLCATGCLGLLFVNFSLKTVLLFVLGICFIFKLADNCLRMDNDIKNLLKKEGKNV